METECDIGINIKKKFCISVRKFSTIQKNMVQWINVFFGGGGGYSILHLWDLFVFEFENIAIVHYMVLNGSLSDAVVLPLCVLSVSSDTAASFLGIYVFACAVVKDISALPRLWRNSLIKALAATNLKILVETDFFCVLFLFQYISRCHWINVIKLQLKKYIYYLFIYCGKKENAASWFPQVHNHKQKYNKWFGTGWERMRKVIVVILFMLKYFNLGTLTRYVSHSQFVDKSKYCFLVYCGLVLPANNLSYNLRYQYLEECSVCSPVCLSFLRWAWS